MNASFWHSPHLSSKGTVGSGNKPDQRLPSQNVLYCTVSLSGNETLVVRIAFTQSFLTPIVMIKKHTNCHHDVYFATELTKHS